MAFAWVFEANFEAGTNAEWTSETDSGSQLDFPHYTELARFPWKHCAPYSGAYCMRATLDGSTDDAVVQQDSMNIAANANNFVKFDIWISPDFTGTANDTVNILEMQETGNAAEATFGLRVVAADDSINFGIGETAPTSWADLDIERGIWYTVELDITVDEGTQDDGTIDLYITRDGEQATTTVQATQVTSLGQGAITHGVLGVQDHLATTTGVILFDNLIHDDARIGTYERFTRERYLTKTGHAFVGPGVVERIDLISGAAADNTVTVYDADNANALGLPKALISNGTAAELVQHVPSDPHFKRGCYCVLAGTNPRAIVTVKRAAMSDAEVRRYGLSVASR